MNSNMHRQGLSYRRALRVSLVVAVMALTGCATGLMYVNHGVQFDVFYDDQDAWVLDYRYMAGSVVQWQASERSVKQHHEFGRDGIYGPMLRGTSLYVKWINKATGRVYEDTVDLRRRLRGNISGHRIDFMIHGSQLYVYEIFDEKRSPGEPPIGPKSYQDKKVLQLYPDQTSAARD